MKKILAIIMIGVFLFTSGFSSTNVRAADADQGNDYLGTIREIEPDFLNYTKVSRFDVSPVIAPWGAGELVEFKVDYETVGYAVFIDSVLIEFSESASPYYGKERTSNDVYYYDFAGYSIVSKTEAQILSENAKTKPDIYKIPEQTRTSYVNTQKTLSNVYPQLQGSNNCIVAALANVMWYWGSHGYSPLTSGMSFANVKTALDTLFNGYYANNSVLSIASSYGTSKCGAYFTGGANWSPSYSTPCAEIAADYPCMVGFAPGSSYSPTVGHMTMCFGYVYTDSYLFLKLADGHTTSTVTKLWTTYNDCVIRLRIH